MWWQPSSTRPDEEPVADRDEVGTLLALPIHTLQPNMTSSGKKPLPAASAWSTLWRESHLSPQMSGDLNSNAPQHLSFLCNALFQHCILKCRDVLQRLGRSSLADLSAALGPARSSDSVRQMAPTAPSSFLPFSP